MAILLRHLKVVIFMCVCISNPLLLTLLTSFPRVLVFLFAGPSVPVMQMPGDPWLLGKHFNWDGLSLCQPIHHDSVGGSEVDTFLSLLSPDSLEPALTLMTTDEAMLRTSVH